MEARWEEVPIIVNWALNKQPSILDNYCPSPSNFRKKDPHFLLYGTSTTPSAKLMKGSNISDILGCRGRSLSISSRVNMVNFKF